MRYNSLGAVAAATLYSSLVDGAVTRTCSGSDSALCFSLNIPDATASSGSGDIFFQIQAPTKYQWVGLGQGSQMAGANIFVMYTSSNGQNVTISPRKGVGHVEPEHDGSNAQVTLLAGSGVKDGNMIANVRCSNCERWDGGSADFGSSNGAWINAAKEGEPLDTDDLNAEISYHDFHNNFMFDYATAKGGNDVNPFVVSASTTGSNQPTTNQTTTTTMSSGSSGPPKNLDTIRKAHAVMAALVFVVLLPTGGILLRLANFANPIVMHASIQMLGYVIWIAAFGMGAWMAHTLDLTDSNHAILGYVIFAIVVLQPIFGYLHHRKFKRTGHRNIWSIPHLTIGRIVIVLGMVNGGLGLQLAGNAPKGALIAYGIIAGLFGIAYFASAVFGETRRMQRKRLESTDSRAPVGDMEQKGAREFES